MRARLRRAMSHARHDALMIDELCRFFFTRSHHESARAAERMRARVDTRAALLTLFYAR